MNIKWTAEQIALLGTAHDTEVSAATGYAVHAVARQRKRLGIPRYRVQRQRADARKFQRWSSTEDSIVMAHSPTEAAARLPGRTTQDVYARRKLLMRSGQTPRSVGRPSSGRVPCTIRLLPDVLSRLKESHPTALIRSEFLERIIMQELDNAR